MSKEGWEYLACLVDVGYRGPGPVRPVQLLSAPDAPVVLLEEWLNERDAEGWELLSLAPCGEDRHGVYATLRRRREPETP